MAERSGLMAYGPDGGVHEPSAVRHQPLAMASIRDLMWRSAGLFRSRDALVDAVRILASANASSSLPPAEYSRHRNLLTVARLIARAALRREESRGGHYREDFPDRQDRRWRIHVVDTSVAY